MTLKLKKILIENFRGIKLPLTIEFVKGGNHTSALIYGRNGTGKSSITEAWEWMNTFRIDRLEGRDGVSAMDHPHKASNGINSYVEVHFQHPSVKSLRVTFNPKKITQPTCTGEYSEFKSISQFPNYLKYSDLQDFVYRTKTEKYRYIAKYFGLELFTKNQSDLQATINRISANLQTHKTNLNENIATINKLTGLPAVDETAVVNFINSIASKHSLALIAQFKDSESIKLALEKIVQANPVTKELTEWKAFQKKQNQFYPVSPLKANCESLEKAFNDLKKDEESIKQLILLSLYEQTIEVIPKLEDKTICPVCDSSFTGDLLDHLRKKHSSLEALRKHKEAFEARRSSLEKQFQTLAKKVSAIQFESSESVLVLFKAFFEEVVSVATALPEITAPLGKQLKDLSKIEISSNPVVAKIDDIVAKEAINKKLVSEKIKALETDEKSKTLATDYTNIANIILSYKNYLINKAKVDYLLGINLNLELLFTALTEFIQTKIQTTFTNISSDVADYFHKLESSNPFIKNPQIKLIADKDKAVELEIEFVTEKITPAFKFLSESQINSFGLAIFLAAVKHFNNDFKFFVLDDVVNSFDSFKRPRVSQLLASKFSDFQILMLTHDQVFFDTMQRDFPTWQRYKFTSWDFTAGPRFMLAQNYAEEIREYLEQDKPIIAGQALGRYLEWTFGVVNESMSTPIRFKLDNIYTLQEFYDPLIKRLKEKLKQPGKLHKLIKAFEEFEQGTIFRNYCAHWKDEANPFTTPEIESIFKKWLEIEKMLYCSSCKSFIKYEKPGGTEYVKCNCGALDLLDSFFYLVEEKDKTGVKV